MGTLLAAARLGDPVAHTASKGWMIAGLIAGAVIGAAAVVVTGGAALTVVAAVAAGAAAGGGIGEVLGTMSWAPRHVTGSLIKGSPNVFINSRAAMRANLSQGVCSDHNGPPQVVAQGSSTVFINRQPASRKDDKLMCGALINDGSPNVFIGGATVGQANSEIPAWVNWTMMAVGVAAAAVLAGPVMAVVGAAGGFAGGGAGSWIGGKVFGEGSDGQKWSMLGGSLLGGYAGAKGAGYATRAGSPASLAGELSQAEATEGVPLPEGIYADPRGVYGYLPKPGSRYASDMYDFSDPEFVARNRQIRIDYLNGSDNLESAIATMREQGASSEEIANRVVWQRNSQKMEARSLMTDEEVNILESGNLKRYGDPVGPTPQQMFDKYGDWETVIQKSMEKDPAINTLLGIPGHR